MPRAYSRAQLRSWAHTKRTSSDILNLNISVVYAFFHYSHFYRIAKHVFACIGWFLLMFCFFRAFPRINKEITKINFIWKLIKIKLSICSVPFWIWIFFVLVSFISFVWYVFSLPIEDPKCLKQRWETEEKKKTSFSTTNCQFCCWCWMKTIRRLWFHFEIK